MDLNYSFANSHDDNWDFQKMEPLRPVEIEVSRQCNLTKKNLAPLVLRHFKQNLYVSLDIFALVNSIRFVSSLLLHWS